MKGEASIACGNFISYKLTKELYWYINEEYSMHSDHQANILETQFKIRSTYFRRIVNKQRTSSKLYYEILLEKRKSLYSTSLTKRGLSQKYPTWQREGDRSFTNDTLFKSTQSQAYILSFKTSPCWVFVWRPSVVNVFSKFLKMEKISHHYVAQYFYLNNLSAASLKA